MSINNLNKFWNNFEDIFYSNVLYEDIKKDISNKKAVLHRYFDDEIEIKHCKNKPMLDEFNNMLKYIIFNHPCSGSRFEDIVSENHSTHKLEVLLSDEILNDNRIVDLFFKNRFELFYFLTSNKQSGEVSVNLSKMHVENILKHNLKFKNKYSYTINISESELHCENFIEKLIYLNKKNNISEFIQFELLEYDIDFKKVEDNMKLLFLNGFNFILDDYGLKHSNKERYVILEKLENEIRKENIDKVFENSLTKAVKIDGTMVSSILFNNNFLEIETLSNNFNIDIMLNIMSHYNNYVDRVQCSKSIDSISLEKLMLEHGIDKEVNSNLYPIFLDLINPNIEAMKNKEKYLEQQGTLLEVCDKLYEVCIMQQAKGKEIVFEFTNMQEVNDLLFGIISSKNMKKDLVYTQGRLHGEKTKPILNIKKGKK